MKFNAGFALGMVAGGSLVLGLAAAFIGGAVVMNIINQEDVESTVTNYFGTEESTMEPLPGFEEQTGPTHSGPLGFERTSEGIKHT